LAKLSGVAAILRFPLVDLEDEGDDDAEDDDTGDTYTEDDDEVEKTQSDTKQVTEVEL
jgi:hypothetical protein